MGDSKRSAPVKVQGVSLIFEKRRRMEAPGSAEAACKEQTGCLRLEGESPLLRFKKRFAFFKFDVTQKRNFV